MRWRKRRPNGARETTTLPNYKLLTNKKADLTGAS
jgi:hypothetical protein